MIWAGYGEQIVSALGRQLEAEYGRGFSMKSLRHMIRFAEAFPDVAIVSALRRQLSWTHFKTIVYKDERINIRISSRDLEALQRPTS